MPRFLSFVLALLLALPTFAQTWRSNGPGGARVAALVQAPSNPNVFYVASSAGVFRSDDRGATYADVTGPLSGIAFLAVSPADANTVYALRGRDAAQPPHLYRSRDGGAHWEPLSTGFPTKFPFLRPSGLIINPRQPDVIYVSGECEVDGFCAGAGLFRSTNGGDSFVRLPGVTWPIAITLDPLSPDTLYVYDSVLGSGRSNDGGQTWTYSRTPLPARSIVADPTNFDRRYGIGSSTLLVSNDGGATWLSGPATLISGDPIPQWFNATLAADPVSGRIFLGTSLNEFSPGGSLFFASNGSRFTELSGEARQPITALSFDAGTSTLTIGTPSGLYRTPDFGATWSEVFFARGTAVNMVAARSGHVVAAGSGVLFRSEDDGNSWSMVRDATPGVTAGDRIATITTTSNGDIYAGLLLSRRLLKFSAATQQWTAPNVSPTIPVAMNAAYVIAGNEPGTVYATTGIFLPFSIAVTRDSGTTWERIAVPEQVFSITPDPTSNRLFIASASNIFRSGDGGATWTNVLTGIRPVSNIAVSENIVAVLTREGLYRSLDGGTTWDKLAAIGGTQQPTILASGRSLFVLGENRIVRSDDGGATWRSISDTLPFTPRAMAIDGAFLHAGTDRGVWELPLVTRRRATAR